MCDEAVSMGTAAVYNEIARIGGTAAARQRGAAATLTRASPGSGPAARLARRALPKPGAGSDRTTSEIRRALPKPGAGSDQASSDTRRACPVRSEGKPAAVFLRRCR